MLDRESTFADPEIVKMLKTEFVPVAIDQAYQRRQKDTEGEFYRKIAGQGPRANFNGTTQGFYIATASGDLLLYNNNRDPDKVRRLMQQRLKEFKRSPAAKRQVSAIERTRVDARYNPTAPEGGLVVRANARILDGYEPTTDRWKAIFQSATSRDNLWVTQAEHEALAAGTVPVTLRQRIARFHLVDNTRGEPPMWRPDEIRVISMSIDNGRLTGSVKISTSNGDRGYEADIYGHVEVAGQEVTKLDVIVLGEFWGEGPYTRGAPKGRFPLAVAFTLADGSDVADGVPPQGSRGWVDGYLRGSR